MKQQMQKNQQADKHPAILALEQFQREMEGEAERSGLDTEEKIVAFVKEIRRENFH